MKTCGLTSFHFVSEIHPVPYTEFDIRREVISFFKYFKYQVIIYSSFSLLSTIELIQNARSDNHALQAACKGALFKIFDSKLPKETPKKIVEADEDGHEAPAPDVLNGATPPSTAGEDAVVDARGRAIQEDEGGRPNEKDAQPHIMISYKWESPSKEVMREIKNKLKAMGYRVWMDEDFMSK